LKFRSITTPEPDEASEVRRLSLKDIRPLNIEQAMDSQIRNESRNGHIMDTITEKAVIFKGILLGVDRMPHCRFTDVHGMQIDS